MSDISALKKSIKLGAKGVADKTYAFKQPANTGSTGMIRWQVTGTLSGGSLMLNGSVVAQDAMLVSNGEATVTLQASNELHAVVRGAKGATLSIAVTAPALMPV